MTDGFSPGYLETFRPNVSPMHLMPYYFQMMMMAMKV